MKKIFYSVLSALLLISCTTSDEPEVKTISEVQHNLHTGKLRTIEEVLDIAANASNMIAPTGNENTGCILLARGNSTQGGHQWVCDGLQNYKIQEKHYESTDGGIT